MKTVIVASTNPVKVEVARRAFATLFPHEQFDFVPVSAPSGVPDQPYEEDTRKGAEQRLAHIKMTHPEREVCMQTVSHFLIWRGLLLRIRMVLMAELLQRVCICLRH